MKKEDIKIGIPIIYWSIIDENGDRFDPLKTIITSEPLELGHGEVVCRVEGVKGAVSISYLDKITAGSLMCAKLKGLTEITMNDIAESTKLYFKEKGINITVNVTP